MKVYRVTSGIWLMIFSLLITGLNGCSENDALLNPEDKLIAIPERVGYALAGTDLAVIDLAAGKVVGFLNTHREGEAVGDFIIGPDGNIYLTIHTSREGEFPKVRVMNPSTGKIITEIEVAYSPRRISAIPGGKAIIEHNGIPRGEEKFACSIIDMNSNTLVKTLYFDGIAEGVLSSKEGKLYIRIADVLNKYGAATLIEFDPFNNDVTGDYIKLENSNCCFEPLELVTDSKIYGCKGLEEEQGSLPPHTLAVFDFPSGKLIKKIDIEEWPHVDILVVGEKAYLTHQSGTSKENGVKLISVIDINKDRIIKTINLPSLPQHIVYSKATGEIYVASTNGKIVVIDPDADSIMRVIECDDERASGWGFRRIRLPD